MVRTLPSRVAVCVGADASRRAKPAGPALAGVNASARDAALLVASRRTHRGGAHPTRRGGQDGLVPLRHRTPCSLPDLDATTGYSVNCYHDNRGTKRGDGYIASCSDGAWTISADQPGNKCPALAPDDGDVCDCAAYYRDRKCSYACVEGGLRVGQCSVTTYRWSVEQPSTCTVVPDGGPLVDGFL